ncbi:MAG: TIGR02281 family clan AA aspartic protease [Methylobacterium sp.]
MGRRWAVLAILAAIAAAVVWLMLGDVGAATGLNEDRFASLVYAGIWCCVLGAGLVTAFRGRVGEALRSAAIWIVAFAALIGAYAFADEFRGVGNRMLAVLLPGRAVSTSDANGSRVLVARAGDAHFHVEATANGRPISFLVDTGASVVALGRDVAETIGIDTSSLRYDARIQTANGIAAAAPVVIDSLRVGSIERRNVRAVVTDGPGLGLSLLGMSFLGTLSSFDFRGDRLILTD